MALSTEKIAKLRELAVRGVDGERESARAILLKHGYSWEKPKEKLGDRVKKIFGGDIKKQYRVRIETASDILLMICILEMMHIESSLYVQEWCIYFVSTPAEQTEIKRMFSINRRNFNSKMQAFAKSQINILNH